MDIFRLKGLENAATMKSRGRKIQRQRESEEEKKRSYNNISVIIIIMMQAERTRYPNEVTSFFEANEFSVFFRMHKLIN